MGATAVEAQHCGTLLGPVPSGIVLDECIAAGARSEVWRVTRIEDGTPLTWKRLRPEFLGDVQSRRAFRREARVLRRAAGPFLADLVRDESESHPPWLLLKWLDGEPLRAEGQRFQKLPVSQAVWIARQIVQGLQALAEAGFAHGGLTPDHVLVMPDGGVRLLGVGDAIRLTGRPTSCPLVVKGTVEYLAPEAFGESGYDPLAAELYSLGVLLFGMLSGRLPFTGENAADVLRLHRQSAPPPLGKYCRQLSTGEIALVESLLRKEPLRRPRFSELLNRLLAWELKWFGLSAAG